ncbi:MAG: ATP-binding domain-containing protein [Acidimicrobiia bacterium]
MTHPSEASESNPQAGTRDAEIAAEQAHLDAAYARLDFMRRAAERVAAGYTEVQRGGTHQARLEREAAEAFSRKRLAALDIGEQPLCFGRLDMKQVDDPFYIGRISVTDDDLENLVVDWRAPVAEPFYRATAVSPMDVARRRHFQTHGRRLVGLDDEVFDADATDDAGFTVVGEGALLAALDRERTGRMRDIVATIQTEQDEAIRADLAGVLIVSGGPGTGKTAVALHRAAYLLYTHRQRLASQGVLLVGPSPIFLRYIDEVLPSLGEDEVSLTTPRALKPRVKVRGTDDPKVGAVKGDVRMVRVVANALRDRERPMPRDTIAVLDTYVLRLRPRDSRRIIERAHQRRGTHNEKRPYVASLVVEHFKREYRRALLDAYRRDHARIDPDFTPEPVDPGQGELFAMPTSPRPVVADVNVAALLAKHEPVPPEWDVELGNRIRKLPEYRAVLERMWPVLSGQELIHDLFGFEALVRSAAKGILSERDMAGLVRERTTSAAEAPWTEADLGLIDEADALLGPVSAARPRSSRRGRRDEAYEMAQRTVDQLGVGAFTNADDILARYGAGAAASGTEGDDEPRTFGHVLVDEAQDLTAMQWRMLARRCPTGSMTLVGDFGQASRPGALSSWDDVLANVPVRVAPRRVELSVNYRTPAEIVEVANRLLPAAAPGVEPARPVRSTGAHPEVELVPRDVLVKATAEAARQSATQGGTVAVIAPDAMHGDIADALADRGAIADDVEAIDAPIAVLGALDSKGLEFDHVVVVEPAALVSPDRSGLRLLYVVLTRATQRLVVVHSEPLPEALDLAPSVRA